MARNSSSFERRTMQAALGRCEMDNLRKLWQQDEGQDIAEYAVMLAVILVIVVGTLRLIGSNANNAFSATASSIQ
jgi:Flp pilus assembly pilin Flp